MEESKFQRGSKRKRYYETPQDMSTKIKGKLHHDLKEVKKAAKKAKAFETQKLVKKLKDLRNKTGVSEGTAEAERQLDLLKELDHELVATTALKTKLIKDRILNENENVQAVISQELATNIAPTISGSDAAKMRSRLLSSKFLASKIASVVSGLKCIIQPPNVSGEFAAENEAAFQRPKKLRKVDHVKKPTFENSTATYQTPVEDVEAEQGIIDVDNMGWESGTVDDEETEEKTGWESGTVDDEETEEKTDWDSGLTIGNRDDESLVDSDDDDKRAIHSPLSRKIPPRPLSTQVPKKPIGMQSTFLPSLSVGFTRGESDDSDLSESEVKVADIEIKKNRRGQRARRAIWEKKFGKNANHKKKEAQATGMDRNGYKRLAVDNKTAPYHVRNAAAQTSQHAIAVPISAPQKLTMMVTPMKRYVEEKSIHPSWEAKRKLKEKDSARIVPSQGTKIKF